MGAPAAITRWVLAAPADRGTPLLAGVVYGSGALLHLYQVSPVGTGLTGPASAGIVYGVVLRVTKSDGTATKAALAALGTGAWLSFAAWQGVTWGPYATMTIFWAVASGAGYAVLRKDQHMRERRRNRAAKRQSHSLPAAVGYPAARVIRTDPTRLGSRMTWDVRETGQRASSLARNSDLAERIAEHLGLPAGRVTIAAGSVAGRITVSVRTRDPWEKPIPHPMLDPDHELDLPAVQSVRDPLVIGQDPETGKPLSFCIWDEDGAHRMAVISTTGGGKSVALSCITERLTACEDVVVWSLNVSKAKEDRRWQPAMGLTAIGPAEREKALRILRLACAAIDYRGAQLADSAVHQPSPGAPMILLRIDELHALTAGHDQTAEDIRECLRYVGQTGRSEAVGILAAGQRGTGQQMGGADTRAMFTLYAFGKTRSASEMGLAAGDIGLTLPNIAEYGENKPGVLLITGLDGDYAIGRTFFFKELTDIDRAAADRRPPELEPGLVAHLGEEYQRLLNGEEPDGDMPALAVPSTVPAGLVRANADLRTELAGVKARATALRQEIEATVNPAEGLDAETMARVEAELARQADESHRQVEIPDKYRAMLAALLLLPDGISVRRAAEFLEQPKTMVHGWLHHLRVTGAAEIRGSGRSSAFHAAPAAIGAGQEASREVSGEVSGTPALRARARRDDSPDDYADTSADD